MNEQQKIFKKIHLMTHHRIYKLVFIAAVPENVRVIAEDVPEGPLAGPGELGAGDRNQIEHNLK